MRSIWAANFRVSAPEPAIGAGSGLAVAVVFTGVKQTLAALRAAGSLARGLKARIHMVVPEVVPYPAPLEQPLVESGFAARKFRTIAEESTIETRVDICLCRDWEAGVLQCVKPRSIVVVGAARRWWRSGRERRLARALRKRGHQVILLASE
jgi:hypothetical protein